MKSYLPYMGSKNPVAEHLASLMPPEATISFMDVFCGGCSPFFGKELARVNVLNDIDEQLMQTHEAVCESPEAVMAEMERLPVSRLYYEEVRQLRDTQEWWGLSKVERAARVVYLAGCAFNANPRAPFSASSMTPIRFKRDRDLRPYAQMLRAATLECLHWAEFLDRYVLKPKRLSCLLLADPPYVVTARAAHYRYRFGHIDHVLLARKLALINSLNGGQRFAKIMVTYDDDPDGLIRTLYREEFGWHLSPLAIRYAAGQHTAKTTELLITNYRIDEGGA